MKGRWVTLTQLAFVLSEPDQLLIFYSTWHYCSPHADLWIKSYCSAGTDLLNRQSFALTQDSNSHFQDCSRFIFHLAPFKPKNSLKTVDSIHPRHFDFFCFQVGDMSWIRQGDQSCDCNWTKIVWFVYTASKLSSVHRTHLLKSTGNPAKWRSTLTRCASHWYSLNYIHLKAESYAWRGKRKLVAVFLSPAVPSVTLQSDSQISKWKNNPLQDAGKVELKEDASNWHTWDLRSFLEIQSVGFVVFNKAFYHAARLRSEAPRCVRVTCDRTDRN